MTTPPPRTSTWSTPPHTSDTPTRPRWPGLSAPPSNAASASNSSARLSPTPSARKTARGCGGGYKTRWKPPALLRAGPADSMSWNPCSTFRCSPSMTRRTVAPACGPDLPARARLRGVKAVPTGPLARYALCSRALRPAARQAARIADLDPRERNPHRSVLVRAVELVHALEEAAVLVDHFEPPPPSLRCPPRVGRGLSAVESPSGLLYQRYDLAADGTVTAARLALEHVYQP